jgi:lipoate-protein ligase A
VKPCFDLPSAGELVSGGRKLVGSAQVRERDALLQHGSILVDDDQALVSALLCRPVPARPSPATLRGLLGRAPAIGEVALAFEAALAAMGCEIAAMPELDDEVQDAVAATVGHYASDAWTWRL